MDASLYKDTDDEEDPSSGRDEDNSKVISHPWKYFFEQIQ
jgi:hypothetical protein